MNKLKHLELCQNVISRMAGNSFLLKGWSVTLTAGLFALAANNANRHFAWIAVMPVTVFWVLDSFYLRQERLFRALYDDVREKPEDRISFSMDTTSFAPGVDSLGRTMASVSEILFYGSLLIVIGTVIYFLS
jgi:hypothetical protein